MHNNEPKFPYPSTEENWIITIFGNNSGKRTTLSTEYGGPSEKAARKVIENQGYKVFRTKKGLTKEKFLEKEDSREWIVKRVESLAKVSFEKVMRAGVPDFLVVDRGEFKLSFLEVKTQDGGLRGSQLHWARLFDELPVKICYCERTGDVHRW